MTEPPKQSIWGVGPSIVLAALAYAAAAGVATYLWPGVFLVHGVPYPVFAAAGGILLAGGLAMLMLAGRSIVTAHARDELVTTGVYALVRNPIYSAWIVFLIPGLVLPSRSWLLFLTPLVAYAVFKLRIRREDAYLRGRFGQAYLDYRRRVREVVPLPRRFG